MNFSIEPNLRAGEGCPHGRSRVGTVSPWPYSVRSTDSEGGITQRRLHETGHVLRHRHYWVECAIVAQGALS